MNILVLSDFFSMFYTSVASYLGDKGYDVSIHFIILNGHLSTTSDILNSCLILPEGESYVSALNIEKILECIQEKKIDIVLFPQISDAELLIKQIKGINPSISCLFLLHSRPDLVLADKKEQFKILKLQDVRSLKKLLAWAFPMFYLFILKLIWRKWAIRQYNVFDKIVVLSPSYVSEYEDIMGMKDVCGKICAIPNPLIEHQRDILVEKKKQIVFVGSLSPVKAVYRLLFIWKKIYKQIPEWKLVIVGDGETRKENQELVKKMSLERIEFLGYQKSIPIIDESSILCLTSNIEGLPTVFTEAMTLGTVPIGFDSFSGIYEMIDNWENGIIIPAFNIDLYADSILRLVSDENLRLSISIKAQEKVRQYDINIVGEKWLSLFKQLKFC